VKPRFFATAEAFRAWLAANHERASQLLVGFWKKNSGKPSMTYAEALDEVLCFGWIDGVRGGGEHSHTIRFTPRKAKSKWSAINVSHVKRLIAAKRMKPAGLKAYEARGDKAGFNYSYETRRPLDPALKAKFEAHAKAWAFFTAQPPGYQRITTWWVMNAKQEATRARRLGLLIANSAQGQRLAGASGSAKARRGAKA
jgi:uncharacterized protein YdeI (YjbR/CyaY-like superfamily)